MIRICSSLTRDYHVSLWGRRKSNEVEKGQKFEQRRFKFFFRNGPIFYFWYNVRIFFHLLFAKVDIIHSVDLDTLPAGYLVSVLRKKKLVYDSHEYFTEVPELISRPRIRNIWLKIERLILPRIKQGITVGRKIADEYEARYGVPFEVIKNCPVLTEHTQIKSSESPYLLYQGALNKGRGLEALIEAMTKLDIKLTIAGSGDLDDELKNLANGLGVNQKIDFLGLVKPEELLQLTSNAYVGINVSENLGLSYYYSLNNKFFDYIHAGIPAITNPFPEYQALNEKYNCLIFARAKSEDIVDAVNLLLNDEEKYNQLKKNTFLAKQELNWQKEEEKLLQLYQKLD